MFAHATAMAQLNVRMSLELKDSAEAVLERMEVTPTQLVRAVWEKVALGEEAFEQLAGALIQRPSVVDAGRWESSDVRTMLAAAFRSDSPRAIPSAFATAMTSRIAPI